MLRVPCQNWRCCPNFLSWLGDPRLPWYTTGLNKVWSKKVVLMDEQRGSPERPFMCCYLLLKELLGAQCTSFDHCCGKGWQMLWIHNESAKFIIKICEMDAMLGLKRSQSSAGAIVGDFMVWSYAAINCKVWQMLPIHNISNWMPDFKHPISSV